MNSNTDPIRQGRFWIFPDGTTLPVVSGGSDVMADVTAGDVAGAVAAEPADMPTGAPAPDGQPAEPVEQDLSLDEIEAAIEAMEKDESTPDASLKEMQKLRRQVARHRAEGAAMKDAFDGLEEGNRTAILNFAKTLQTDPQAAFDWLVNSAMVMAGDQWPAIIKTYLPDGTEQVEVTDSAPADQPEFDPRDPESIAAYVQKQVEAGIAQYQTAVQESQRVAEQTALIDSTLKDLGYEGGPTSPTVKALLLQAKEIGGDPIEAIKKAHEALEAEKEQQFQQYLEKKAAGSGQSVPTNGQAAGGNTTTDDLSRDERINRRLDDVFGPQTRRS